MFFYTIVSLYHMSYASLVAQSTSQGIAQGLIWDVGVYNVVVTIITARFFQLLTQKSNILLMEEIQRSPPGMYKTNVNNWIFTISTGDRWISKPSTVGPENQPFQNDNHLNQTSILGFQPLP